MNAKKERKKSKRKHKTNNLRQQKQRISSLRNDNIYDENDEKSSDDHADNEGITSDQSTKLTKGKFSFSFLYFLYFIKINFL